MNAIAPGILDRLRAIVGPKGVIDQPADIAPYLLESRGRYGGTSPLVLRPASTADVAAIVAVCRETGTKLVPQGGNTSLVGGSIPFQTGDEILLSLSRMNRVRTIDPLNDTITVEAGCILQAVQEAARASGRLFPLRIAAEGSCQIGGNISSNAGGTAVLKYGNMRELVLGLEVVLPDGQVWDGLRGLRKDNTGYDLKQIFIGAEGTLGIVTAAVLKLFPIPAAVETAVIAVPSPTAALDLLALAKELSGNQVTAFELLPRIAIDFALRHGAGTRAPLDPIADWQVLVELSGGRDLRSTMEAIFEAGVERGLTTDGAIASSGDQARAFWQVREAIPDAQKPEGGSIKCDVAVPVSRTADFLARATAAVEAACPGIRVVAFGHLGDGNIHFNLSQPIGADTASYLARWEELTTIVHRLIAEMGGSISAEHGVGRMKRDEITHYKSAVEIELMRTLKRALDPTNIMNPDKVVRI